MKGEWKNGLLDGKAVQNNADSREEYEAKEGKRNGKCIRYIEDGSYELIEYKDGKLHGRCRHCNKGGVI